MSRGKRTAISFGRAEVDLSRSTVSTPVVDGENELRVIRQHTGKLRDELWGVGFERCQMVATPNLNDPDLFTKTLRGFAVVLEDETAPLADDGSDVGQCR